MRADVLSHIESQDGDIVFFSPFFNQPAIFINVFEQAREHGEEMFTLLEEYFAVIDKNVNISTILMSSTNTVFCNFFAAKKQFWNVWFEYCERIYRIAEENSTTLGKRLNANVAHGGGECSVKVFVIERISSFILATQHGWEINFYNPIGPPYFVSGIESYENEMRQLDALKVAFMKNKYTEYMETFINIRLKLIEQINQKKQ